MSILNFFVERKSPPKKVEREEAPPAISPQYTLPAGSGANISEFNEHFRDILRAENAANFPGNDFYEFFVMKNNMKGLPEQQAYQIAFSGLSAAGLSKERLLSTAQKYLEVIEKEISDFNQSFDKTYHELVISPQEVIAQKSKEIKDLQDKIAQLVNECNTLSNESNSNAMKLNQKAESFRMAGNAQKQEIENEITKINQYI